MRRLTADTDVFRHNVRATVAAREQAWFDKTLMQLVLAQTPDQVPQPTQEKINYAAEFTEGPLARCKQELAAHLATKDPVDLFMAERRANNPHEDYLPEVWFVRSARRLTDTHTHTHSNTQSSSISFPRGRRRSTGATQNSPTALPLSHLTSDCESVDYYPLDTPLDASHPPPPARLPVSLRHTRRV